jgi:DNA-binding MarR family transcriptional regulator
MQAKKIRFYGSNRDQIVESVGYSLWQVALAMRRETASRLLSLGLTEAQWRPLWMLKAGRADTAQVLARLLGVDAGAMTRMLDRLEAKGLIERVRSVTDRRVTQLRLTASGEAATEGLPEVVAGVNNDYLLGFSRDEFEQLKSLLARMRANGQALAPLDGDGDEPQADR